MRRRPLLAAVVGLVCLACTSCIQSTNPLSDPDQSVADSALYGVWVAPTSDGGTQVMVVGQLAELSSRKDVPRGIMRQTTSSISKDGFVGAPGQQVFFTSTVGRDTYLNMFGAGVLDANVYKTWSKGNISQYQLLRYRVSGDKLELWDGDEHALGAAIDKGLILGTVTHDKDNPTQVTGANLTDTTDNMVRFFAGTGGALVFPDSTKTVYTRMPNVK
jgi:hypothetical protein